MASTCVFDLWGDLSACVPRLAKLPHIPQNGRMRNEHQIIDLLKNLSRLTDAQISAKTGGAIARDKVSRLRSGSYRLTFDDAERLAEAFGVPPSIFFQQPEEAAQTAIRSGILGTTGQGQPGSRCNPVPSWWGDLPAAA